MPIDNGMIPRRYWAPIRSRVQEARSRLPIPSLEFFTGATVFTAVLFNLGLALLNANILGIGRGLVIFAEVIILAAAVAICARSFNRLMIPWIIVASLLAILFIILSMFRQSIEPKYFRDVLVIPVFIALGLTFAKGNIVKLFVTLQAFILAVMIFEGVWTNLFGNTVNPLSYYVNTRGRNIESFWTPHSLLYYSSFRPPGHGRFFDLFNLLGNLRLSSVFLEPVSLGNWCIVITIFLTAFWQNLSRKTAVFFVLSTIALLIGSDGRLASVTIIMIVALSILALRSPRYSYLLYLPGAIVVTVFLVTAFEPILTDNFLGRLAKSARILSSMDMSSVLGLDPALIQRSADSGISYFVSTQSLLGLAVLWASICFFQPPTSRTAIIFMHGLCLYIALVLMISYSMFSIKTAAPLWFLYGYVRARSASLS